MKTLYGLFPVFCLLFFTLNAVNGQELVAQDKASASDKNPIQQVVSYEVAAQRVVRSTYAKLTKFNRAMLLVRSTDMDQKLASEDRYLRFELTNFKVGPIQEILSSPHSEILTRESGELLQIGRVTTLHNGRDPHVAYSAEWRPAGYSPGYDSRWTIGDLINYNIATHHDVGGYASFDVSVSFRGKKRAYKAFALFRNPYGVTENLMPLFYDPIVSMGGSLKDVWNEKRPAVGDKPQGGIRTEPRSDIPELASFGIVRLGKVSDAQLSTGVANKRRMSSSSESPVPTSLTYTGETYDTREHSAGHHGERVHFEDSCAALNTSQQRCTVKIVGTADFETGTVTNLFYRHRWIIDQITGSQDGPRGTPISCYSARGMAVKNCPPDPLGCEMSGSLVGSGLSMQMTGGDVWRGQVVHGKTCNIAKPSGGGTCMQSVGSTAKSAKSSGKESPNLINPSCCSSVERADCFNGGGVWYESNCTCASPIVIDVAGNGFNLTNAADGVPFDLARIGSVEQFSWTAANSDDAWLVLDRNGNGTIDDGGELFGSSTSQPYLEPGEQKNGFRALAMFDKPENGGNGDGEIDASDAIFSSLKLWQDSNHNGRSEGGELQDLANSPIRVIELQYKEAKRQDENGNWFRYRAKVRDARGSDINRWAWDVFLQKPK